MRVIFLVLLNLMFFECFSESFEICSKKEFEKMYLDRCSLDDNGDLFQQIIIDYPNMSKEDIYLKIELFLNTIQMGAIENMNILNLRINRVVV